MTDMEALEALVGEWTTEVDHADLGAVRGELSTQWLDGGGYLIQRGTLENPAFPRFIALIGPDRSGDRIVQHYFDSRGVARVYEISLDNGVLRLWRDDPEDFSQRYTGRFSDDGSAIEGAWERAEPDGTWVHDFGLTYRRR
jgi:hypothetical protein